MSLEARLSYSRIIDISQPVTSRTACFPGDTPFSRSVTLNYEDSKVINLTALTMSPHVGSHADAPVHIKGSFNDKETARAGTLDLKPFLGEVYVIDISDTREAIDKQVQHRLLSLAGKFERVLFKTLKHIDYETFAESYSYLSTDCATTLGENGFRLVGLDTPSVDHIHAKELSTHNVLDHFGLVWLENLDLTEVEEGAYQLIALPLKFMELEASPLRAVLLK